MIAIDLGTIEYFNSEENEFVYEKGGIVRFEYTLKVLYAWEGKWKKPFLKGGLTNEETVDFYKMMALDPVKDEFLTGDVLNVLAKYIADPNMATTFSTNADGQNGNGTVNNKKYTAEEIYALMFTAGIPIEFENRNLNRLIAIIRIISIYNNPKKKMMSTNDIYRQNAKLNAERKAKMKTRG